MAQEGDLPHAVGDKLLTLPHNRLDRAALLAAANVRHDTVGAEVVAARHDGHPGVEALGAVTGKVGRETATFLDGVDLDGLLVVAKGIGKKFGQRRQGARTKDDVGDGNLLLDFLAVALSNAAADSNDAFAAGRLRGAHHS